MRAGVPSACFEPLGADQRRGPPQPQDVEHLAGDVDPRLGAHLLADERHREQRGQVVGAHRLRGCPGAAGAAAASGRWGTTLNQACGEPVVGEDLAHGSLLAWSGVVGPTGAARRAAATDATRSRPSESANMTRCAGAGTSTGRGSSTSTAWSGWPSSPSPGPPTPWPACARPGTAWCSPPTTRRPPSPSSGQRLAEAGIEADARRDRHLRAGGRLDARARARRAVVCADGGVLEALAARGVSRSSPRARPTRWWWAGRGASTSTSSPRRPPPCARGHGSSAPTRTPPTPRPERLLPGFGGDPRRGGHRRPGRPPRWPASRTSRWWRCSATRAPDAAHRGGGPALHRRRPGAAARASLRAGALRA